jgi:hypothetical protein
MHDHHENDHQPPDIVDKIEPYFAGILIIHDYSLS